MTIKQLNRPGENLKTIIHGKNTVSIVCLFFTKMSIEVMGDFWEILIPAAHLVLHKDIII